MISKKLLAWFQENRGEEEAPPKPPVWDPNRPIELQKHWSPALASSPAGPMQHVPSVGLDDETIDEISNLVDTREPEDIMAANDGDQAFVAVHPETAQAGTMSSEEYEEQMLFPTLAELALETAQGDIRPGPSETDVPRDLTHAGHPYAMGVESLWSHVAASGSVPAFVEAGGPSLNAMEESVQDTAQTEEQILDVHDRAARAAAAAAALHHIGEPINRAVNAAEAALDPPGTVDFDCARVVHPDLNAPYTPTDILATPHEHPPAAADLANVTHPADEHAKPASVATAPSTGSKLLPVPEEALLLRGRPAVMQDRGPQISSSLFQTSGASSRLSASTLMSGQCSEGLQLQGLASDLDLSGSPPTHLLLQYAASSSAGTSSVGIETSRISNAPPGLEEERADDFNDVVWEETLEAGFEGEDAGMPEDQQELMHQVRMHDLTSRAAAAAGALAHLGTSPRRAALMAETLLDPAQVVDFDAAHVHVPIPVTPAPSAASMDLDKILETGTIPPGVCAARAATPDMDPPADAVLNATGVTRADVAASVPHTAAMTAPHALREKWEHVAQAAAAAGGLHCTGQRVREAVQLAEVAVEAAAVVDATSAHQQLTAGTVTMPFNADPTEAAEGAAYQADIGPETLIHHPTEHPNFHHVNTLDITVPPPVLHSLDAATRDQKPGPLEPSGPTIEPPSDPFAVGLHNETAKEAAAAAALHYVGLRIPQACTAAEVVTQPASIVELASGLAAYTQDVVGEYIPSPSLATLPGATRSPSGRLMLPPGLSPKSCMSKKKEGEPAEGLRTGQERRVSFDVPAEQVTAELLRNGGAAWGAENATQAMMSLLQLPPAALPEASAPDPRAASGATSPFAAAVTTSAATTSRVAVFGGTGTVGDTSTADQQLPLAKDLGTGFMSGGYTGEGQLPRVESDLLGTASSQLSSTAATAGANRIATTAQSAAAPGDAGGYLGTSLMSGSSAAGSSPGTRGVGSHAIEFLDTVSEEGSAGIDVFEEVSLTTGRSGARTPDFHVRIQEPETGRVVDPGESSSEDQDDVLLPALTPSDLLTLDAFAEDLPAADLSPADGPADMDYVSTYSPAGATAGSADGSMSIDSSPSGYISDSVVPTGSSNTSQLAHAPSGASSSAASGTNASQGRSRPSFESTKSNAAADSTADADASQNKDGDMSNQVPPTRDLHVMVPPAPTGRAAAIRSLSTSPNTSMRAIPLRRISLPGTPVELQRTGYARSAPGSPTDFHRLGLLRRSTEIKRPSAASAPADSSHTPLRTAQSGISDISAGSWLLLCPHAHPQHHHHSIMEPCRLEEMVEADVQLHGDVAGASLDPTPPVMPMHVGRHMLEIHDRMVTEAATAGALVARGEPVRDAVQQVQQVAANEGISPDDLVPPEVPPAAAIALVSAAGPAAAAALADVCPLAVAVAEPEAETAKEPKEHERSVILRHVLDDAASGADLSLQELSELARQIEAFADLRDVVTRKAAGAGCLVATGEPIKFAAKVILQGMQNPEQALQEFVAADDASSEELGGMLQIVPGDYSEEGARAFAAIAPAGDADVTGPPPT